MRPNLRHRCIARNLEVPPGSTGDLFGFTGCVDVRGVDEIDTGHQCLADQFLRLRLLQCADVLPDSLGAAGRELK